MAEEEAKSRGATRIGERSRACDVMLLEVVSWRRISIGFHDLDDFFYLVSVISI